MPHPPLTANTCEGGREGGPCVICEGGPCILCEGGPCVLCEGGPCIICEGGPQCRINRLMGLAQGKSCGPLGVKKSGAILPPTQGRIYYLELAYPGRTVLGQGDGVREAQFP